MKLAFLRVRAEQVFKIHHKSCFQHTVSLALALINNSDSAPQSKGTNPQLMHKHFLPLQSFTCFFFPLSFQKEFWMVNSTVLVRKTPLHFRLFSSLPFWILCWRTEASLDSWLFCKAWRAECRKVHWHHSRSRSPSDRRLKKLQSDKTLAASWLFEKSPACWGSVSGGGWEKTKLFAVKRKSLSFGNLQCSLADFQDS